MNITIDMDESDFERLTTNMTRWAESWDESWEGQVEEGRFEHSTEKYDTPPRSDWVMAYWAGDDWTHVMLCRAFLAAKGYEYEVMWDQTDQDPEYVILTSYVTKTWRDLEWQQRQAEEDTGIMRGDLVVSDDFGGLGKVTGFNFAQPKLQVLVRIPNGEPPIQVFPVNRVRLVTRPGAAVNADVTVEDIRQGGRS